MPPHRANCGIRSLFVTVVTTRCAVNVAIYALVILVRARLAMCAGARVAVDAGER
jgi:hypothetical protein